MEDRRDVHGFTVLGGEGTEHGLDFLDHGLTYEEAKVFFNEARYKGKAKFQDSQRRDFILKYNGDGTYAVEKRHESKGFFGGWF